jgi:hypothetical protein
MLSADAETAAQRSSRILELPEVWAEKGRTGGKEE